MSEAMERIDPKGGVFAQGGKMKTAGYIGPFYKFPNYLTDLPYPATQEFRQPFYPVAPQAVQGEKLKVWTADHDGVTLGGQSIVIAHSEAEARALLRVELDQNWCDPKKEIKLTLVDTDKPQAIIINNGDY